MFWVICIFLFLFSNVKCPKPPQEKEHKMDPLPATIDETRHQVSLRIKKTEDNQYGTGHYCSGAVISSSVILTAAHCLLFNIHGEYIFLPAKDITVVLGSLNRFYRSAQSYEYEVKNYVYPKYFDGKHVDGDIALVTLIGEIPENSTIYIKPIPVTTGVVEISTTCRISGWGKISKHRKTSDVLLITDVTVADKNICRKKYPHLASRVNLEDQICVKWSNLVGSCTADSGSPMVCGDVLVGVFSGTAQTCDPEFPSLLTDISCYKDTVLRSISSYDRRYSGINCIVLSKLIIIGVLFVWMHYYCPCYLI